MYKVKAAIAGGVLAALMATAALSGTISQAISDNAYKSWKQYGETWSSMTLGSSGETVARSGCAVTSAAILMVKSGSVTDDSFTPATLVSYLSANGGFSASGGINWNKLTNYAPSFVYCGKSALSGTQQQKAEKMQSLIDQGYYLEAVVKNGGHFVAVDSVSGSDVTMMDPGSKSTSLFDKYAASGVVSLRLFKGANSTVKVSEETAETEAPAAETEPIETTVTEIETTEVTTVYTTEAAEETTEITTEITTEAITEETTGETAEETTEVTTTAVTTTEVTTTESTTTETKKETTTTAAVTTTAAPATTAPTVTTAAAATTLAPPPAPTPIMSAPPAPVYIAEEPDTAQQTIIPSRAEAELFRINNMNIFMSVRFTTTDKLHLRENPNTQSDILLVIPEGTALDVVEIDAAFHWGRVAYNGKEGWISLDYAGL